MKKIKRFLSIVLAFGMMSVSGLSVNISAKDDVAVAQNNVVNEKDAQNKIVNKKDESGYFPILSFKFPEEVGKSYYGSHEIFNQIYNLTFIENLRNHFSSASLKDSKISKQEAQEQGKQTVVMGSVGFYVYGSDTPEQKKQRELDYVNIANKTFGAVKEYILSDAFKEGDFVVSKNFAKNIQTDTNKAKKEEKVKQVEAVTLEGFKDAVRQVNIFFSDDQMAPEKALKTAQDKINEINAKN